MLSEESVAELNRRLPAGSPPLPLDRFRPNIVVASGSAHGAPNYEDGWARFSVGGVACRGVKRCSRCIVTTTDQATGKQAGKAGQPLATLRTYRTGATAATDAAVFMGMVRTQWGTAASRTRARMHTHTRKPPTHTHTRKHTRTLQNVVFEHVAGAPAVIAVGDAVNVTGYDGAIGPA